MRRVLLLIVLVLACGRERATDTAPAPSPHIADEELVAFTRWQRELAELLIRHRAELDAVSRDDPSRPVDEVTEAMVPRVQELVARQAPRMKAHLDRVPVKGRKADLLTEVTGGIFHLEHKPDAYELVVARDEVRLDAARRRFGAEAVDDILARESLILAELQHRAGGEALPAPSAAELEAFVTGAGNVHLGMTESEVSEALGKKPTRRNDPTQPGGSAEATWEGLAGASPGAASGQFLEGRLVSIEFAPARPALPRVDRASAESVTHPDFVRRSVARTLRMADIETITRVRGYRATWAISGGFGNKTTVMSRWLWEIEPGGTVLYVDERDGAAGQPVIRSMR